MVSVIIVVKLCRNLGSRDNRTKPSKVYELVPNYSNWSTGMMSLLRTK